MILEAEIKVFDTGFTSSICCDCSALAKVDFIPLGEFYMEVPDSSIVLTTQDSRTECHTLKIRKHFSS